MKNFAKFDSMNAGFEKFSNSNKKKDSGKKVNKANKTVRGTKFVEDYN